jgi:DNA primase
MIDQATIERILEAAPIEAVVGEYVNLRRRGANYIACCPFHNEKTPSFSVSPSKGIFKCFGCGKAGNVVRFIMEHEQLSYVEALRFLAAKYNISIEEKEESAEQIESRMRRDSMLIVNNFACEFYARYLWEDPAGQAIGLGYFRERGFNDVIIKQFQLGFAPGGRDHLTRAALDAGYKQDLLVSTGLTLHYPAQENKPETVLDRFQERVMFPIHSLSGRIIGFGGRTLRTDKQVAKYVNSPESEIYNKSKSLYGIYFAKSYIARLQKCYLVEGYTDVLSLFQAGICNVVASSGTSLTGEQIRLIKRFAPQVTVLYDGDDAGIKASVRGIDMLLEEGLQVKVVRFPDGDDPDSFARKHNASEILDFLEKNETDFIHFKIALMADEMQDPLKRSGLIRNVMNSIAVVPDAITRTVYIEECSRHLDIQESLLTREVIKIRKDRTVYAHPAEILPLPPATEEMQVTPGDDELSHSERDILYYLLKFGQAVIDNTTVEDYIFSSLREDDLEFHDPVYRKLMEEYTHLSGDDEARIKHFNNHQDVSLSQQALSLLGNPHPINLKVLKDSLPVEETLLKENVIKAVLVYKSRIVARTCTELTRQLHTAQLTGDELQMQELMKQLITMMDVRNSFAKELKRLN